ncbi:hypothetical protein C0Q70_17003 [Pomacea canaliculata]|uniref:Topoisomerase 6 subunit A/Spo11 TOPRIM domain-containing protein n=1 Tax=Pomacea canaliculata TaxID=400727 RepID=A0A2T7NRC6_POMCA|nr:hypothetical protein C0Q70_17003 [Pomacea canaliculata]
MLEVPRWKLHVLATCKGLVAGNLQFYDEYGHHIDLVHILRIINTLNNTADMHSGARFVLIVEKDATFQKLLTDNLCENFFAKIIIITGKGFPDIGTRLLVHKLWETFHLPTFALMDADPHGIHPLDKSFAQAFENHHLAVPAIKWLGILPTDIPRLAIEENTIIQQTEEDLQNLLGMLNRPYILINRKISEQIETMIQRGVKAELQCLDSIHPSYLTNIYLPGKIQSQDWI